MPLAGGGAVQREHEDVVAERLEVVGRPVARTVPSLWSSGLRSLAFMGRWQPKQLVIHDVWQA